jgi:hypothetical protein
LRECTAVDAEGGKDPDSCPAAGRPFREKAAALGGKAIMGLI